MTSDVAFPDRFTEIDELTRPYHYWLTDDDRCYFLGEYTAGRGYSYSQTNQLILNFKKSLDRQGKPEWPVQAVCAYFKRLLRSGARWARVHPHTCSCLCHRRRPAAIRFTMIE